MKRLLLLALLLASCSKEEPCPEHVSHYTRYPGSDVYQLVESYPGNDKPEDYTEGEVEHIFILENICL